MSLKTSHLSPYPSSHHSSQAALPRSILIEILDLHVMFYDEPQIEDCVYALELKGMTDSA